MSLSMSVSPWNSVASLVPQRFQRIHPRGPTRRHVTRHQRDDEQNNRHQRERRHVSSRDFKQQRRDQPCQRKRRGQTTKNTHTSPHPYPPPPPHSTIPHAP